MKNISRFVIIHSPKSTRAHKYDQKIRPQILKVAKENDFKFIEIPIVDMPYFLARDTIKKKLLDNDLVVAVGGDGLINVTLDAIISSDKKSTLATIPAGNINDFSSSINGRIKDPVKILSSGVMDFYPLELKINEEELIFSAQYISFGATTALVDWLNSPRIRRLRKRYRGNIILVGATGVFYMSQVSKNIAEMKIPPIKHSGEILQKNSFGFFIGRTSKYFRLAKNQTFHNDKNEFLFHVDNFYGRTIRDLIKMTRWLIFGIPGEVSRVEKLKFETSADLVCQIGGDNIILKDVSELTCQRSKKSIKMIAPKFK